MTKKKVSFDFDGCLDTDQVFEYAQELKLRDDVEMFITTSRVSDDMAGPNWNHDLYEIAINCRIPFANIKFMNTTPKWYHIKEKDFIWHLDDDWEAIGKINEKTNTVGITNFGNKNWKDECNNLLNL